MEPILSTNFNVKDIAYGQPKVNDNGGKSIYISLNKSPILLQTPEMYAPFGMSKWENDKGLPKYTLDLSFKDMESKPMIRAFYDRMNELDEKLILDAVENSFDWMKKKNVSHDVMSALYTKQVKHPIDKATGEITNKYPATFKLNLPFRDGEFKCDVFDSKTKSLVNLTEIETKGSRVTAIIQCLGIWVAAGKFGCTWKVVQMKVMPPRGISGYAFKDVPSEAGVTETDEEDNVCGEVHSEFVVNSDDDLDK